MSRSTCWKWMTICLWTYPWCLTWLGTSLANAASLACVKIDMNRLETPKVNIMSARRSIPMTPGRIHGYMVSVYSNRISILQNWAILYFYTWLFWDRNYSILQNWAVIYITPETCAFIRLLQPTMFGFKCYVLRLGMRPRWCQ